MSATGTQAHAYEAPLPRAQFKRFIILFHVVFILGLLFSLLLRYRRPEFAWNWQDLLVVALVATQIALYALFFVVEWKPPGALNWWLAYFAASFGIWLAEWRLEPALQWTAWAYLGQMFGVMRPIISVPVGIVVSSTFFVLAFGWRNMSGWGWVSAFWVVISTTALGLFLHRLTVTSCERAKLIQELEAAKD